ncbi:MAG: flagellin, partial [Planctomycetes bacterium]|nr:flagellin [Planctomycetota bacterium]
QKAELTFAAAGMGSQAVTVTVQGPKGIVTLQFPASAAAAQIITQINTEQEATGVTASAAVNPSPPPTALGVLIQSEGYGTKEFVSIQEVGVPTGGFPLLDSSGAVTTTRQFGVDAAGTINGAPTIGDGLILKLNSSLLDIEITLDETFGASKTSFAITSGGSLFQLGPEVNTNQQENIGVKSMQPNMLGNRLVGFLSELQSGQRFDLRGEKFREASDVINEVITQVSFLRGRLGSFERNTLQTNINQLEITNENLISSESVIRDTDFALETSNLTRAQILVQAGNSVLAIANAQAQNVLTLLGG